SAKCRSRCCPSQTSALCKTVSAFRLHLEYFREELRRQGPNGIHQKQSKCHCPTSLRAKPVSKRRLRILRKEGESQPYPRCHRPRWGGTAGGSILDYRRIHPAMC